MAALFLCGGHSQTQTADLTFSKYDEQLRDFLLSQCVYVLRPPLNCTITAFYYLPTAEMCLVLLLGFLFILPINFFINN